MLILTVAFPKFRQIRQDIRHILRVRFYKNQPRKALADVLIYNLLLILRDRGACIHIRRPPKFLGLFKISIGKHNKIIPQPLAECPCDAADLLPLHRLVIIPKVTDIRSVSI